MRFIMRNIIKYRVKVIHQNIKLAFPEKSASEIKDIERKAYKHLIDYIVEGIKAFTMPKKVIIKRHKLLIPKL